MGGKKNEFLKPSFGYNKILFSSCNNLNWFPFISTGKQSIMLCKWMDITACLLLSLFLSLSRLCLLENNKKVPKTMKDDIISRSLQINNNCYRKWTRWLWHHLTTWCLSSVAVFVLPNNSQQTLPIKHENQTTRRQLRDWSTKDLAIIHAAHSMEGYRCSALYTCGFSAVFLSFKCRGVKTVKIHAYMCVYAQRQKYAFLTDLSRCANAWFCFINVTVETGTCTVGELHNYPLMNVEMLFNAVCWLLRRSLCEEKVHLRGSPSASEQLSLCITVSAAAAISGPWTCTCEPSTRCYLGGCLNGVSRCILSDPIARGQL